LGITTEPERQFNLVKQHIASVRKIQELAFSLIQIIVERNLGFEAEHMERALKFEENVVFYRDSHANRTGVLTTENVKLGAMTLTNVMLREKRVHIMPGAQLVSLDHASARRRLREQLEIFSFQFKTPENVFQKGRFALSGKVGGLKDDVVICLQLGLYWTESSKLLSLAS
jgi:hypothetical protein